MIALETLLQYALAILLKRTTLTVDMTRITCEYKTLPQGEHAAGVCQEIILKDWSTRHQILIDPAHHKDEAAIIATLIHELIHAAVGCKKGHNRTFQKHMKDVGLYAIHVNAETITLLRDIYETLGWELKRRAA